MSRKTLIYSLVLGVVCVAGVLFPFPSVLTRGAPRLQSTSTASPAPAEFARITTANARRVVHVKTTFPPIDCFCVLPNSFAWSPDGNMLAVTVSSGVSLYDINALDTSPRLLKRELGCSNVVFSPDGTLVACGANNGTVQLWDVKSGKTLRLMQGQRSVKGLAFTEDGSTLAVAYYQGGIDSRLRLWNVRTGSIRYLATDNVAIFSNMAMTGDGGLFAFGGKDTHVHLWDAKKDREITVLYGHTDLVVSFGFSADGKSLVSGSWDKTVRVWNVDHPGQDTSSIVLNGHTDKVYDAKFSPDGSIVASGGGDETLRLWDAITGEQLAILSAQTGKITSVAFNPSGTLLASGNDEGTIWLWGVGIEN